MSPSHEIKISILKKFDTTQLERGVDILVNGVKTHFPLYNSSNSPALYYYLSEKWGNAYIDTEILNEGIVTYFIKYLKTNYPEIEPGTISYYIDGNENIAKFFQYCLDYDGTPTQKNILRDVLFFAELWTHTRKVDKDAYNDAWCIVVTIT